MKKNSRLEELEKEATIDIRKKQVFKTNPEFLQLSIESFLEKYNELQNMSAEDAFKRRSILYNDENFMLMMSFYKFYFDENGKEKTYLSDLFKYSDIEDYLDLEKRFCSDIRGNNTEGIISPDGVFYPAVKSHYCICSWLNLKGIDIRKYVRTTMGSMSTLLFSDLSGYITLDKEYDFELSEKQIKAMRTLFRIDTEDSKFASFHNSVEESYRYGFCRFVDPEKTRRQIGLMEDVLGKSQVDSRDILSTKIRFY